jgi:riboflavin kinase/FMN adenylyltransferase
VKIWDDLSDVPDDWPASVVTIGVFDGVHRGHRELIRRAANRARVLDIPTVVLTFWPNPAEVVKRGDPPARLATLEQRLRLFAELGVSATLVLPFTPELSQASPEMFAGSIVAEGLRAKEVIVGENFRFGHRARGDVALMAEVGKRLGICVEGVHLTTADRAGDPVSSTMIRRLVADGEIAAANRALARPHRVEGVVIPGEGRGREMGFPTANLAATPYAAIPADGVYAGRIVVDPYGDATVYRAAISVGTNPTFEEDISRRVEAWAYEEDDLELYDVPVAVDFAALIRKQKKFNSTDELIAEVNDDLAKIKIVMGEHAH